MSRPGRGARRSSGRAGPSSPGHSSLAHLPVGPVPTSLASAELVRREDGVLLLLDGTESSYLDLRDPTRLDFEYHQQMDAVAEVLLGRGTPLRALHLGGAGCALARAWDRTRPGSAQLAVEIDEALARYARQWFDLPRSPRLRIRVGDAARVLPELRPGQWDVVVRDVFTRSAVPPNCRDEAFLASCLRALRPGGIALINTVSPPRPELGAELGLLRRLFGGLLVVADPPVARGARPGNLVLVCRREPFAPDQCREVEHAVRRLPLPVRTWSPEDRALPGA
ncbi:fused MFS/spermidine synthase [Actinomyces bowdenii]|uniref:spermidine synthase n=1 Tax=Actinomyces bowdenii TaxID=131109 RepID=UPI001ABCE4BB|nr:fused MFS/spermidine synthase [Actinomyces bowdenii]MBO3724287.1 fused MFS/spermidine synthase [Actinomyces bowdenii]